MIRVMHFANVINRDDFIDVILQNADRARFQLFACVRNIHSNIAPPSYPSDVAQLFLPGIHPSGISAAPWRVAEFLRWFRIDILHTHHDDQAVIGWLATRLYHSAKLVLPGTIQMPFIVGSPAEETIAARNRAPRKLSGGLHNHGTPKNLSTAGLAVC